MLTVIGRTDFDAALAADPYYKGRWPFFQAAADLVAPIAVHLHEPGRVLELGAYQLPIVRGCTTMDILAGVDPDILHDALETPWPVEDGSVDLFVALQVFEHLGDHEGPRANEGQQKAWLEVARILAPGGRVLLSLPYRWPATAGEWHGGITWHTIADWTGGLMPDDVVVIFQHQQRILLLYTLP